MVVTHYTDSTMKSSTFERLMDESRDESFFPPLADRGDDGRTVLEYKVRVAKRADTGFESSRQFGSDHTSRIRGTHLMGRYGGTS